MHVPVLHTLSVSKGGPNLFATDTYTGTGAAKTIRNGVDLDTYEGLVWIKDRYRSSSFKLTDTVRGATKSLISEDTNVEETEAQGVTAFNLYGYVLGTDNDYNAVDEEYVAWTFREKPKFFDIVTYTGTGSANNVAHSLGVAPGMVIVKCRSAAGNWAVYHRSNTAAPETDYLRLDTENATADLNTIWNDTAPTDAVFTVGTHAAVNTLNETYVAYLFGHSTTEGIIQCGGYTGTSTTNAISLGWRPGFLLIKKTNNTDNWAIMDSKRSSTTPPVAVLFPDSVAKNEVSKSGVTFTSTGFTLTSNTFNVNTDTYIYMAIRA